jgi:hypothetical protein
MTNSTCPICGGKLHTTNTRKLRVNLWQYRSCHGCDYRDRATVRPAEILYVEVVQKRTSRNQSSPAIG